MYFLDIKGWYYIISDEDFREISIKLMGCFSGDIEVYAMKELSEEGRKHYRVSGSVWKEVINDLKEIYNRNFQNIDKLLQENGLLKKVLRKESYLGAYSYKFKDIDKYERIKLFEIESRLRNKYDILIKLT